MTDIHTCSYHCERPACIRAQRDELLARAEAAEARVRELEAHAADRESEIETIKFERQKAEDEAEAAERDAKELRAALQRAREDINWMLNNRQFLNGPVFDYLDAAIATTEQADED